MKTSLTKIALCTYCFMLASAAQAAPQRSGPVLGLKVGVESHDNILLNTKAQEKSDNALVIAPKAQYHSFIGKHRASVEYSGEYVSFMDYDQQNYQNHELLANAQLNHHNRLSSEYELSYVNRIEAPGQNDLTQDLDGFIKYDAFGAEFSGAYGTQDSQGQIVLTYDYEQQNYHNTAQKFRDVDIHGLQGIFYYRLAPKTRLLFELNNTLFDYKPSERTDRSSINHQFLSGVEWSMTAQTRSSVRVGYLRKNYDSNLLKSDSGLSYYVDIYWRPQTYTLIGIEAERSTSESAIEDAASYFTTRWEVNAEHELTPRTQLYASYTFTKNDIVTLQKRIDKRNDISLGFRHSLDRWLVLDIGFQHMQRSSTLKTVEFDANRLNLSLTAEFD